MSIYRDTAIRNTHATVVNINFTNDGVTEVWDKDGKNVVLDESAISTEMERLMAENIALEYARKRRPDYPEIGDQMDMIYKDMKNGTSTHADAVEAVKAKWPKDNSGPVE